MKAALECLGNPSENIPPEWFRNGGKAHSTTVRGTCPESSLVTTAVTALEAAKSPTGTLPKPIQYRVSVCRLEPFQIPFPKPFQSQ